MVFSHLGPEDIPPKARSAMRWSVAWSWPQISRGERACMMYAHKCPEKCHLIVAQCRSAVGLVPADTVRQHNCSAQIFSKISSACIPDQNPQNILGSQHLFSVYIHTPPGQSGVPRSSHHASIGKSQLDALPSWSLSCVWVTHMAHACAAAADSRDHPERTQTNRNKCDLRAAHENSAPRP